METCEKCGKRLRRDTITHHHILPQTHYNGKGKIVPMCKDCHLEIEKIYLNAEGRKRSKRTKLTEFEYYTLYYEYIWGKDYEIYMGVTH